MNFDELIECSRCGSDASYQQKVNDKVILELCYGCGFQSNSVMTSGSLFLEEQLPLLPDLYKSLIQEEEDGKLWMPTHIHVEGTGSIFADGVSSDDWAWAGVLAKEVEESEKEILKGATYKSDMTTIKHFPSERGFIDALSYIGVLPE